MINSFMKPKWQHDCLNCKYLGSIDQTKGQSDWYKCGSSVIARFGNEGSQYWSSSFDIIFDDRYVADTYREMTVLARFMLLPKLVQFQCGACSEDYWSIRGQVCSCPSCGMT